MKRDDTLWKGILEAVFDDFLVFFFKEKAELFDFDKGFVFLDKELEQLFPTGGERDSPKFVDKLVKVFTKDGNEEWVLVHVEVQGYTDKEFAKRMFTYFYRILDHYDKAVTCITIFTDSNKNFAPSTYSYNFLGTEALFKYNTYKIIGQDEDELRKSDNPFALVILTALLALKRGEVTEETLLGFKMGLVKTLFQKQIPKPKIEAILIFLKNYVRFGNAEIMAKFEKEIDLITNKHTTMGIKELVLQRAKNEGIEIGIEQGIEKERNEKNFEFVKTLLTATDFTVEKIANLVIVPVSFVEKVKATLN